MITPDQVQDIRGMLTEACDLHISDGGRILSSCFDNERGGRCPIGCLVGSSSEGGYIGPATSILGIKEDTEVLLDFVYAFDNNLDYPATRSPLAALGHELRAKYLPVVMP